jgi:hypothetical protein
MWQGDQHLRALSVMWVGIGLRVAGSSRLLSISQLGVKL